MIEYSVDDGAFQSYTGPFAIARQGTTIVRARATDRERNIEDSASSSAIMIDGSSPAVSINSPASRDYLHSDTLQMSFGATDSVSGLADGVLATLDDVVVANGQTIQPFMLALGLHRLSVSASDRAGNTVSQAVDFRVTATIDSVIAAVRVFAGQNRIGPHVASRLVAKLTNAREALHRGNVLAARRMLRAFSNHVSALSGRSIAPEAAQVLLADVQYVLGAV